MRLSRPLAAFACVASVIATSAALPSAQGVGYPHGVVVSDNPVNYTPHALDGTVRAIATVGNVVYVGGTFTKVTNAGSTTQLTRGYLFAFNRTSGEVLLDFAPVLDGVVETIAPGPNGSIIIGGRFKTVDGAAQRSLAMLGADGRRVATFSAKTDGYVTKALVRGSRVVVGGRFSTVTGGVPRANLAAFDATTGALDGFNISVTEGRTKSSGTVTKAAIVEMDADASGSKLVIIGNFRRVGGALRQQIATIDLSAGRVTDWFTNRYPNDVAGTQAFKCYQVFETQMRDVEFSPDGNYFVVVTTGGAPDFNKTSLCDTTARFETTSTAAPTGAVETWKNCTGGDTLYSVAVTNAAVYVGGHQRWLDNC